MKASINSVEIKRQMPNTSRLPYLSANFFDNVMPTIIKIIPPALNKPNPAETGSSPKKLIPYYERK